MRHGKKINALGRKAAHRKAMLANMACSLIEHKRVKTTVAKAKALRTYIEPLITKAKNDTTHSRRVVFSYLKNKEAIKELFGEISKRVADRPGGYCRILKIGNRLGDNAEMALIELVDFNEFGYSVGKGKASSKKKRRRGGGRKKAAAPAVTEEVVAAVEAEEVVEAVVEETPEVVEAEVQAEVTETEAEETPAEEEATEDTSSDDEEKKES